MNEPACRKCGASKDEASLLLVKVRGGVAEHECEDVTACLCRQRGEDPARNAAEVLHRDPAIECEWQTLGFDPESDPDPCENMSWFAVERSDGTSPHRALPDMHCTRFEACEYHVAEVIDWMMDGDDKLHAIVRPRWWNDNPESTLMSPEPRKEG